MNNNKNGYTKRAARTSLAGAFIALAAIAYWQKNINLAGVFLMLALATLLAL